MPDRVFYALIALAAVVLTALAIVWPQGMGARSPGPFGHPVAAKPPPAPKGKIKPPGLL